MDGLKPSAAQVAPVMAHWAEGDAQVQAAQGAQGGGPAPDASPAATPGQTKGEQLRDALYKSARRRFDNQEDIMSAEAIKAQKGAFSTCTTFEYQVAGDAAAATQAGKFTEDLKALDKMLNKEAEIGFSVEEQKKSVERAGAAVKTWQDKIAENAADPKLLEQQRTARAKVYQRQLASAEADLKKATDKLAKLEGDLAAKKAEEGKAFTHFEPGTAARPKQGDFIRIGIYEDKDYTANGQTVRLRKGSFLHVCVFEKLEKKDKNTEIWHTIDGGKQKPTLGLAGGPSEVKLNERKIGNNLLLGWTNVASLADEGLPGGEPSAGK